MHGFLLTPRVVNPVCIFLLHSNLIYLIANLDVEIVTLDKSSLKETKNLESWEIGADFFFPPISATSHIHELLGNEGVLQPPPHPPLVSCHAPITTTQLVLTNEGFLGPPSPPLAVSALTKFGSASLYYRCHTRIQILTRQILFKSCFG